MVTIRGQLSICHSNSFADLDQWPSNTGVLFYFNLFFFFNFGHVHTALFTAVRGLSLVVKRGCSSLVAVRRLLFAVASLGEHSSRHGGFSRCTQGLINCGLGTPEYVGFSSYSSQAPELWLSSCGAWA